MYFPPHGTPPLDKSPAHLHPHFMMQVRRLTFAALLLASSANLAPAGTLFVDASATGAGTGATWTDAFVDLQAALGAATTGDEIWVAAGIYTPSPNDAAVSFVLKDGVSLYGGFAGGETSLAQRDWDLNLTTLSGDIGQDDVVGSGVNWYLGWNIHTSNSGHVLKAVGLGSGTIVDGFTVASGDTGPAGTPAGNELMYGSGLYCVNSAPVLRNLTFLHNESAWAPGAGAYLYDSDATIEDCHFLENYAYLSNGGGLYVGGTSQPVIQRCEFARNVASGGYSDASGGGAYFGGSVPAEISSSTFEDNQARQPYAQSAYTTYGGGLGAFTSGVTVRDCIFLRNHANLGGGLFTWGNSTIINTVFDNNESFTTSNDPYPEHGGWGGALMAQSFVSTTTRVVQCTVANNTGKKYAGLVGAGNANLVIDNSIVWGNTATHPETHGGWKEQVAGSFDLAYSCVATIFAPPAPGEDPLDPAKLPGVIDTDPQFTSPSDLHLSAASPCLDAGRNDLSAADTLLDLDHGGRAQDDPAPDTGFGNAPLVDMGAFERGATSLTVDVASLSEATGGTQTMSLDLGPAHAGELYLVIGTTSGTTPGLAVGGVTIPLNPDAYTNQTLLSANQAPFIGTLGLLDPSGQATASLVLPPSLLVGLAGLRADHAAVTLAGPQVTAATGTVPIVIKP